MSEICRGKLEHLQLFEHCHVGKLAALEAPQKVLLVHETIQCGWQSVSRQQLSIMWTPVFAGLRLHLLPACHFHTVEGF
jgi:hypothetical protein